MGQPFEWTQSKAIIAVRNTIGDPSGAATERWNSDEIATYLDRSGLCVVLDTGTILETAWDFDLVSGQQEYVQAKNFIEARAVKWWKEDNESDQRWLEYLTIDQWETLYARDPVAPGAPSHYMIWNKLLSDPTTTTQPPIMFLRPVPGATEDGDKIRVWGNKFPDLMDSTDNYAKMMELKGHHVEAQISMAAALAFWDDDEAGKAQAMESRYQRLVEKIKNDTARKDRSRRPRIRPRASTLNMLDRRRIAALPQWFPGA